MVKNALKLSFECWTANKPLNVVEFINCINQFLGPLASGIPGEVAGMWMVYQAHGKLKWEDLVEPSIKLAEQGIIVNKAFALAIQAIKRKVEKEVNGIDAFPGLK